MLSFSTLSKPSTILKADSLKKNASKIKTIIKTDKVNITRKTLQKYYELNRPKNNFMFYKIDKQGNLYKKDN